MGLCASRRGRGRGSDRSGVVGIATKAGLVEEEPVQPSRLFLSVGLSFPRGATQSTENYKYKEETRQVKKTKSVDTYRVSQVVQLFHAHRLDQGTALVRKDIERSFSVVVSNTGGTRASKGQVRHNKVDQRIVDDHSTRTRMVQDVINRLLVLAEDIQRQRLIPLVDVLHSLDQTFDHHDGQDWSKDLALHQLVVPINTQDQSWAHEQVIFFTLASSDDLALGLIEESLESLEMVLVDDTTVGSRGLDRGSVKLLDGGLEGFDEFVLDTTLDDEVVGCDAGLTTVEELAKG